ncbi:baseplate protein [Pantoea phage Phynn]|nr:baseplate protein [Pantoea phage Phynn]
MRKHKMIDLPKYGIKYRPLTVGDDNTEDCIQGKEKLFRHQRDYVGIMAMFAGLGKDSVDLRVQCTECKSQIPFSLNKNSIMVEELTNTVFGNDIKLSVNPYKTGSEDIPDLIDFVVIDGEQIYWSECSDREKEAVLDSIDFAVYKQINDALRQPAPVANIPVRCSCGCERIVSLRGFEAFLKVV